MIRDILELNRLRGNAKLSSGEVEALRERKLRALIRHAYDHVPYYRALFQSARLSPSDIKTVEDLRHVPITTKENIRQAGCDQTMAGTAYLCPTIAVTTSGTTGTPLTIYLSPEELRTRQLIEFRSLLAVGLRPRDVLVILGPEKARTSRLHERFGMYRTEVIPAALSTEEQMRRLRELKPTVLWAYPTVLRAVLHQANYRLEALCTPRILITSAEPLDQVMRDRIVGGSSIEMFNFYGANEIGRIAYECPAHEGLHVNADHVILECVADGSRMNGSRSGGVVLTALNALAMPFIRYRLEDVCAMTYRRCSCGSSFPLIDAPGGRESDLLRLPNGTLRSPWELHFILRNVGGINQFRFLQDELDHLVLEIVPACHFSVASLAQIRSRLLDILGGSIRLDIHLVDFIRSESRKFKLFVSRLPKI